MLLNSNSLNKLPNYKINMNICKILKKHEHNIYIYIYRYRYRQIDIDNPDVDRQTDRYLGR